MKTGLKCIKRKSLPSTWDISLEDLHPVLREILLARGIQTKKEIEKDIQNLHFYDSLSNISKAVELLWHAIEHQERILIVGDFDVDGATATTLAVTALKQFGAKEVDFLVPNRFIQGYGLTPELIDIALQLKPHLIITVDNGINQHQAVRYAKDHGIKVLITDHHLPSEELPDADAIVNPNLVNDLFPSKHLSGVGVIFYVMLALRAKLREIHWFHQAQIAEPSMAQFLDLVALGTVADVVPLDHNNRILVHHGLHRIKHEQCRVGLLALLRVAKKEPRNLVASDLGFLIAPRLNAAGRIEHMSLGIECLLSQDFSKAMELAHQLDQLNAERIFIEKEMQASAHQHLNGIRIDSSKKSFGICLYDSNWHQGVIGIIASRLKDLYYEPVIIFANQNEEEIKGSGRSIPELNLRDLLVHIDRKHPQLIEKFGGHAMAAGLSLKKNNFLSFQKVFFEELKEWFQKDLPFAVIETDGSLVDDDINLPFAQLIEQHGPWGSGFPEPVFQGDFLVIDQRIVGQKHLKLILKSLTSHYSVEAISFHVDLEYWPNPQIKKIHLAYQLSINDYRNTCSLQLKVLQMQPVSD